MSTRREFLKTLGVAFFSTSGAPLLFGSCVGGLATYHAQLKGHKINVPKGKINTQSNPSGILLIQTPQLTGSIVLRNVAGEGIVALSAICSHRGCEVRPMPHSFQCPCHGSEYDIFGNVIEGPASRPLKRFSIEETSKSIIIKVL